MINDFVLVGIILFLAGINVYEKVRYDKREKDFLNRLMSRDFSQYVTGSQALERRPAPVTVEEVADHIVDMAASGETTTEEPGVIRVGS